MSLSNIALTVLYSLSSSSTSGTKITRVGHGDTSLSWFPTGVKCLKRGLELVTSVHSWKILGANQLENGSLDGFRCFPD